MYPRQPDDLNPARGIINALILSAYIWIIIGSIVILLSGCATKPWTKGEMALGAAALTATGLDWAQTRNLSRNPDKFRERNPLLGGHPSTQKVDLFVASSITLGALIAHFGPSLIPESWVEFRESFRTVFLGLWAATEGIVIIGNWNTGTAARW